FPNVGPATDEIPSQAMMATIAIHSGSRPLIEPFDLRLVAIGNLAFQGV
ncbi:MAG: hypothetical protein RIS06_897, partial [Actinomycetota bacterium]